MRRKATVKLKVPKSPGKKQNVIQNAVNAKHRTNPGLLGLHKLQNKKP